MARPKSLTSMSVEALVKLRDDIAGVLTTRAEDLRRQLSSLTGTGSAERATRRGSKLKGRKVAPKYRDRSGNTWSGRGATPRWMKAAMKAGAKRDDFLIEKSAANAGKRKARR
jgi:DNA-binding protein H-NS